MEGSSSNYILISLFLLLTLGNSVIAGRVTPKTNTEFIKTSCSTTMYPQLCFTSLSSHSKAIQMNPKVLAHTALSLSLNTTKSMSEMMVQLSGSQNMSHRIASAMRDCVEELSDSMDLLKNSLTEMNQLGGRNSGLVIGDIQTWVSAALTDDDTCMDGFGESVMNDSMKNVVQTGVVKIAQITSNALSLVNSYVSKYN